MSLNRVTEAHLRPELDPNGRGMTRVPSRDRHEKTWGAYNDAPPNFQPCDPNEFWHWYSLYGFYADREFRQFVIPDAPHPAPVRIMTGPKPMASVHLYFAAGNTGYGLVLKHHYDKNSPVGYRYEQLTYKFYLCEHDIEHIGTPANCLNRYCCRKCGWTYEVDSSD